jgi:hypothetical protein
MMMLSRMLFFLFFAAAMGMKRFNDELSYRGQKKRKDNSDMETTASSSTASSSSASASSKKVLGNMFLANKLSAKDVQAIQHANYHEGNDHAWEWAKIGNWGHTPNHFARDLMKSLLRGVQMPEIFLWPIPIWNPDAKQNEIVEIPFLLPHEVIHYMVKKQGIAKYILSETGGGTYDDFTRSLFSRAGMDDSETIPIGLHGDGVPYTKSDSIEIISWNYLSMPKGERVPFTAISKRFVSKSTWDAVLSVFKWSMLMLFMGQVSQYLPDGSIWNKPWQLRVLVPGAKLLAKGLLCQVRGDWPFLR